MPKTTNNARPPSVLEVRLGDTVVGTLTNLPNDQNLFVFDPAYIADANRPVLSLSLYDAYRNLIMNVRPVTRRLPPFFSNLLPEGALREFIAERGEINAQREFFLLWLLGKDLPGAVTEGYAEGYAVTRRNSESSETCVQARSARLTREWNRRSCSIINCREQANALSEPKQCSFAYCQPSIPFNAYRQSLRIKSSFTHLVRDIVLCKGRGNEYA